MANILIVDDRPTNRQYLVSLLGYGGHRLLEAEDGAKALSLVQAEHPDLVITDILMPTMDGFEFVQKLRAEPALSSTPVIFYTATYRESEARKLAAACGVESVLSKPSEPQVILDTVQKTLGGTSPEPVPIPPNAEKASRATHLRLIDEELHEYLSDLQSANTQFADLIEHGSTLTAERDRLANVAARFSNLVSDLQSMSQRLASLNELSFDLMAERDAEKLPALFCKAARKIMRCRYAAIGILAEDERTPRDFYSDSLEPEVAASGPPSADLSLLERVVSERRVVRLGKVAADPGSFGLSPGHSPLRSFIGAPILTSMRLYGSFYFADKIGRDEFDDDDERVVESLAVQMAVAFENARLYEEIQRHAAQLQLEISERKKAEKLLRKQTEELARSNKDLEQFAYVASHDLQEPLRAVSGCLQILQRHYQSQIDAEADELIVHAVDGAQRLLTLIQGLLTIARLSTTGSRFQPVDCEKAVEAALQNLSVTIKENGAFITRDALPTVTGDFTQLTLLFQNLIANAIKFRHKQQQPCIHVGAKSNGKVWTLSVRDNGIGIDAKYYERIFQIFQRLHTRKEYPGTGIGLAICQKIVERHGGRIWVESAPQQGSTFLLDLPTHGEKT